MKLIKEVNGISLWLIVFWWTWWYGWYDSLFRWLLGTLAQHQLETVVWCRCAKSEMYQKYAQYVGFRPILNKTISNLSFDQFDSENKKKILDLRNRFTRKHNSSTIRFIVKNMIIYYFIQKIEYYVHSNWCNKAESSEFHHFLVLLQIHRNPT